MEKAVIPVVQSMDALNNISDKKNKSKDGKHFLISAEELKELKKHAQTSFTAMAHLNTDLHRCRKDDMQGSLGKEYRFLRHNKWEKTENPEDLFSKDAEKKAYKLFTKKPSSYGYSKGKKHTQKTPRPSKNASTPREGHQVGTTTTTTTTTSNNKQQQYRQQQKN